MPASVSAVCVSAAMTSYTGRCHDSVPAVMPWWIIPGGTLRVPGRGVGGAAHGVGSGVHEEGGGDVGAPEVLVHQHRARPGALLPRQPGPLRSLRPRAAPASSPSGSDTASAPKEVREGDPQRQWRPWFICHNLGA